MGGKEMVVRFGNVSFKEKESFPVPRVKEALARGSWHTTPGSFAHLPSSVLRTLCAQAQLSPGRTPGGKLLFLPFGEGTGWSWVDLRGLEAPQSQERNWGARSGWIMGNGQCLVGSEGPREGGRCLVQGWLAGIGSSSASKGCRGGCKAGRSWRSQVG